MTSISKLKTDYVGRPKTLFWLALRTGALTVLTLGFYRFWQKTRIRRYYWSSIRPGGMPLEYTGTGVEKLMGFLVAVVVLAFYIGIVNLILVFLSFSIVNNNIAAYVMSFVGLIPLYFYARYRARRYVLARTRWRGMRFGIEAAAWSYAWRAMVHWTLTILTLGIMLPRQVFWLEKFRVDRTWLGSTRFHQEGHWKMLRPVARHFYIGLGLTIITPIAGVFQPAAFALFLISVPWLIFGLVHFRVQSFRILAGYKRLGGIIGFTAGPNTWQIIRIYVFGSMLIYLCLMAVFMVLGVAVVLLALVFGNSAAISSGDIETVFSSGPAGPVAVALSVAVYFSVFLFSSALGSIFVTMPMIRHYAQSITVWNAFAVADITQRPRDEISEAEGFAEALDIGAAI